MAPGIGRPGQYLVDSAKAPASPVAGANRPLVEPSGDGLDAHRTRSAVTQQCEAEDRPHSLGMEGVNLQPLLDLGAALLGGHHPIADRRQ